MDIITGLSLFLQAYDMAIRSFDPHKKKPQAVNCRNCAHFYITWDQRHPYGCKMMGFKTRRLPCMLVKDSSGMDCQAFKQKPVQKKK